MYYGLRRAGCSVQYLPHGFVCCQVLTDDQGDPMDFILHDVNPAFEEMTGFSREEIIGMPLMEILPGMDKQGLDCLLKEGSISFRDPVHFRDRWYRLMAYRVDAGFLVAIFYEITGKQEVDFVLEEQEAIFSKIIHHSWAKSLPVAAGLSLAVYFQPAHLFGGDSYDLIKVNSSLIFYLSHVSGKSRDSIWQSLFIKKTIKDFLFFSALHQMTPNHILQYLWGQLQKEKEWERSTLQIFLGILDLKTGELMYSGVGFSPAPMVRMGSGERRTLHDQGQSLPSFSPFPRHSLQEGRLVMTPGTTLFCNTAGIEEQEFGGRVYGERLSHVFYKNANLPPAFILRSIERDFCSFNNDSLQGNEDITFLVLQMNPQMEGFYLDLSTDFQELQRMRSAVLSRFGDLEESHTLITCLYELTANAMEHGNQMDSSKRVSIEISVSPGYILFCVEDEGEGFNYGEVMDWSLELEGKTHRGRGIAMTMLFCDDLFYNARGNRVMCMIKTHQGGV